MRDRDRGRKRTGRRDNRLSSRKRRALVAQVRAEGEALGIPCFRCTRPIDYTLPWPDPWCYTLDETRPRALGGDPESRADVAPAHLTCNAAAGARLGNALRRVPGQQQRGQGSGSHTSRSWG